MSTTESMALPSESVIGHFGTTKARSIHPCRSSSRCSGYGERLGSTGTTAQVGLQGSHRVHAGQFLTCSVALHELFTEGAGYALRLLEKRRSASRFKSGLHYSRRDTGPGSIGPGGVIAPKVKMSLFQSDHRRRRRHLRGWPSTDIDTAHDCRSIEYDTRCARSHGSHLNLHA